ncbi:FMN-binding protein [Kibdelosporangium persicum]|uniref:Urocanate reductase n=1 Tax=Kibdelosporangium persicum TaxID=2698649 RepID=A0ABX2F753_9PSEU|nr:FMN-binding protein [Kibdelosporangium persicum]NRN66722.1 Urocanate reductase [Kibdelosporangium persicum]
MRRAIPAIVATAVGFVLVWQYEPTMSTEQVALPSPNTVPALPPGSATQQPMPGTDSPGQARTVDGSAERNRHGVVQVQVTFTGQKITDVTFLQLPNSGPSRMAGPRLVQETLQAQSADVETVSGATQTSESYIKSLQSAIDAKGA